MRKCNREFIDCLSECATNVLRGNVPLSSRGFYRYSCPRSLPSTQKFICRVGDQNNDLLTNLKMFFNCSLVILISVSLLFNIRMIIRIIMNFLNLSL